MRRIGISVAVPEPWGRVLQDYRVGTGDRAATGIPTHITLVPPMEVSEHELPAAIETVESVSADTTSFRAALRGTGTFRPISPVVFVNVVEGISQLELMASALAVGPLAQQREFPYHPHVTVAQGVGEPELDRAFADLADFEAAFTIEELWLYAYTERQGWVPKKSFSLRRSPEPGVVIAR